MSAADPFTVPDDQLTLPRGPLVDHLLSAHSTVAAAVAQGRPVTQEELIALEYHLRSVAAFTATPVGLVPRPGVVPPWLRTRALDVMLEHRRVRNVRSCSAKGCGWRPERPGNTSDPDDTRRRHAQFNAHVVDLILGLL